MKKPQNSKPGLLKTDETVLIGIQIVFGFLGIFGIAFIFKKYGETTSCVTFDIAYKITFVLFLLSAFISRLLYKVFNQRGLILYIPLIFVFAFLLLLVSYHLDYLKIYEQAVGGTKTYQGYIREGGMCDKFLIRLFSK